MLTNTSKFIKGNKNKHTIVKVLMKCQSQIQNPNPQLSAQLPARATFDGFWARQSAHSLSRY